MESKVIDRAEKLVDENEKSSLKGTLFSVMIVGTFITLMFVGVFWLYMSRV